MATITASTGALDVNSIVSQLMQVEQQPISKIDTKITTVSDQISAVGKLQSAFAALQDAARTLLNSSTWSAATAKSSDDTAVSITAGAGAPAGTYSITVDKLAQNQTAVSGRLAASTTVIGGGTLHLQMGTSDAGAFSADAARPAVDITIPDGATLADVRTAINNANAGVTASLVNDGGQVRLMLRSTEGGASNAFEMTATDGAGSTLSQFATASLTQTADAQDAEFTLGGLALKSASNHVENVLDGVTLDLQKEGSSATLSVASDQASIRKSVDAFVTAYNTLNSQLRDLTKYDATTKTGGVLQGNYVIVSAMSRVRNMVTQSVGSGALSSLSQAGIAIQRDGSLAVDDGKFTAAAANLSGLKALFSASATDTAQSGVARQLDTAITQLLGVDGAITGSNDRLNKQKNTLQSDKDRLQTNLDLTQQRLIKQYTTLNTQVTDMQNAGNALIAQLSKL